MKQIAVWVLILSFFAIGQAQIKVFRDIAFGDSYLEVAAKVSQDERLMQTYSNQPVGEDTLYSTAIIEIPFSVRFYFHEGKLFRAFFQGENSYKIEDFELKLLSEYQVIEDLLSQRFGAPDLDTIINTHNYDTDGGAFWVVEEEDKSVDIWIQEQNYEYFINLLIVQDSVFKQTKGIETQNEEESINDVIDDF